MNQSGKTQQSVHAMTVNDGGNGANGANGTNGANNQSSFNIRNLCTKSVIVTLIITGVFTLIIFVGLFGGGWKRVPFDQYGFVKSTINQKVDTSLVYGPGIYYLGPAFEFLLFPSVLMWINISASSLQVISNSGSSFNLTVNFWVRINGSALASVYANYESSTYEDQITKDAITVFKSLSPNFNLSCFYQNVSQITRIAEEQTREVLAPKGFILEPNKYTIFSVTLPESIAETTLQTQVQIQNTLTNGYIEKQIEVQQGTSLIVSQYTAQTQAIMQTTNAKVSQLLTNAQSQANAIQSKATGEGIAYVKNLLGASEQSIPNIMRAFVYSQTNTQFVIGAPNLYVGARTP